jgi:hypothetical protein
MAFRKLFFKRVQGIRDNYLLQDGDIALDEDDFQLYRGDGSTIGGIAITSTGGTSADTVSTGNGTDVTVTGGESTASGSTGGNTIITGGIGVTTGGNTNITGGAGDTTGGNVNINGGNGSTDGNINIGTENTTLITIGTSGNNIDFPATTTIDFTGATVTGLGVSGIANDILNDTTPQLGGNLDLNNFDITGTGDINITGTITSSGNNTFTGTTDFDTITTDGLSISDNSISATRSNDDLTLSASGTGLVVVRSNMRFNDNDKLLFGDSDDLEVFHNGSHSFIKDSGTGSLKLLSNNFNVRNVADTEHGITYTSGGAVELYHNGVKKLETTATGVTVSSDLLLGSSTAVSSVLDEDNFASDSATALATQQSIKAYVDGRFTQTTTTVNTLATDGLTITDNNVSANRTNDDLILSSSGTGSININGTVTGTGVLDEDNMASNSANHLATQQSIKAYVDTTVAATNELVEDSTPQLGGDLDLNSNNITGTGNINITGTITSTGGFTGTTDFNTITTDGLTIADNNVSANRTNDDLILSASGTGDVIINSNAKFNDNVKLLLGDSDDLQIWHTGVDSIIQNSTGQLQLRGNTIRLLNAATDEDFAFFNDDGSVDLYHNNTKRFETTSDGISVTDHIALADEGELRLGTDNDMLIKHSGVSGLIKTVTGTLVLQGPTVRIQDAGSSQSAFSAANGVATLYHTNTEVLNTTAGGIRIEKGVQEKFATVTGASGVTALDCSNGHIFYKTGCTGDITANFTNLTLTAEYAVNLMVIINQGATPYEVTAVQIGGAAQTLNWQGGAAPTGNANGIDAFSFTILNDGGSYVVLGQMVDFT